MVESKRKRAQRKWEEFKLQFQGSSCESLALSEPLSWTNINKQQTSLLLGSFQQELCIQGRRMVSWAQDNLRRLSNILHFTTIERWRCFDPCTSRQPQCVPVTPLMLRETTWASRAAESIDKKKKSVFYATGRTLRLRRKFHHPCGGSERFWWTMAQSIRSDMRLSCSVGP